MYLIQLFFTIHDYLSSRSNVPSTSSLLQVSRLSQSPAVSMPVHERQSWPQSTMIEQVNLKKEKNI